jgi:uncharacterized membrane protein YjdF
MFPPKPTLLVWFLNSPIGIAVVKLNDADGCANEVINIEVVMIIDCINVFIVFSCRYAFSTQIFCLIFISASVKTIS